MRLVSLQESPAVVLILSSSALSNIPTSFTLNLSDRLGVPF